MKICAAVHVTPVVAILLISSRFCSAQDKPIGDVAREAQAQKSDAHHAKKLITDDDIGPDRGALHETDDPVTVVREAWRAFIADAGHTCHGELTNNSGPGSVVKSLIEAQGLTDAMIVDSNPNVFCHTSLSFLERRIRLPLRGWTKSRFGDDRVGIPSHPELLRRGTAVGLRNELHPNWMMPGNEYPNTPAIFFVDFPKVGHKIDLLEPGPQANPIGPQHIQEQAV